MPDRHLIGEVRTRFNAAIQAANIGVPTQSSGTRAASVLESLPEGFIVSDGKLPAIYVLFTGDDITGRTVSTEDRSLNFEAVLLAQGVQEPQDQLEALQLGVELAISGSEQLGGLATACRYLGSSIGRSQGELITGRRTLRYAIDLNITRDDPRL